MRRQLATGGFSPPFRPPLDAEVDVRQQQDMFWDGRRSEVDLGAGPDWAALARSFGLAAHDDLAAGLAEPGPALIHVPIDPDADCLPMFTPGTPARKMIMADVAEGTRLAG